MICVTTVTYLVFILQEKEKKTPEIMGHKRKRKTESYNKTQRGQFQNGEKTDSKFRLVGLVCSI